MNAFIDSLERCNPQVSNLKLRIGARVYEGSVTHRVDGEIQSVTFSGRLVNSLIHVSGIGKEFMRLYFGYLEGGEPSPPWYLGDMHDETVALILRSHNESKRG